MRVWHLELTMVKVRFVTIAAWLLWTTNSMRGLGLEK